MVAHRFITYAQLPCWPTSRYQGTIYFWVTVAHSRRCLFCSAYKTAPRWQLANVTSKKSQCEWFPISPYNTHCVSTGKRSQRWLPTRSCQLCDIHMHQVYCCVKTPYHSDIQQGDPKSPELVCVWGVTAGKVTHFDDRTFNEVTGKWHAL